MRYFINTELASFINVEQAIDGIQAVFAYPTSQLPNTLLQTFQTEDHSNQETCYFYMQFSHPSGDLEFFLKSEPFTVEQLKVQLHNTCATKLLGTVKQTLSKSPVLNR